MTSLISSDKMRIRICLVLLLVTTCSTASKAQVGTLEEAIQAAIENREPAYLKDISKEMTRELHAIALARDLNSPRAKLTWLLAMQGIVRAAYSVVSTAAKKAAHCARIDSANGVAASAATDAAWGTGQIAALDAGYWAAYSALINRAYIVASNAAKMALENGPINVYAGRICWRVAEWTVQNYLLENLEAIINGVDEIEGVFDAVLAKLPDNLENNPFDGKTFALFYAERVGWRVAEWSVQNYLLENLEAIINGVDEIEGVFDAVLAKLPDNLENNPFDDKTFALFLDKHFGHLDRDEMLFLAPWLFQIASIEQVPEVHQPLFRAMRLTLHGWEQASVILLGYRHAIEFNNQNSNAIKYNPNDPATWISHHDEITFNQDTGEPQLTLNDTGTVEENMILSILPRDVVYTLLFTLIQVHLFAGK